MVETSQTIATSQNSNCNFIRSRLKHHNSSPITWRRPWRAAPTLEKVSGAHIGGEVDEDAGVQYLRVVADLVLERAAAPPPSSPEDRRAQPSRQLGGATPPSRCDIPGRRLSGSPNLPAVLHLSCADPGDTGGRRGATRPIQTAAFDSSNRRGGGAESGRTAVSFPSGARSIDSAEAGHPSLGGAQPPCAGA
ncbi:unnamed protein product [Urochloa humidicola]